MPSISSRLKAWKTARQNHRFFGFFLRHWILTASLATVMLAAFATSAVVYVRYAKLVGQRLGHGSLRTSSQIYAAPRLIGTGDTLSRQELITRLQRAGYTDQPDNQVGRYRLLEGGVEITTGPESYFQPHTVQVQFAGDKIARIFSVTENRATESWWVEPELITSVLDKGRGKRRPVSFSEFPEHLVHAVTSVEDKRFFQHTGLDMIRVAKAAYVDIKERRKEQGASTLTMQLARNFWLDQDKNWKRKLTEAIIALELERRFSKQEIFQMYANEVYLGRRGSFSVHGFGEAAQSFFGKDVRELTVPEAATLAGIIQRPSYYNPFRYPERVTERRNLVLTMMHNNGYLTAEQLQAAQNTPLKLSPGEIEASDAPYFVDLVNTELNDRFEDWDFARNAYRIYSTLDMDLQQDAIEAVQAGLESLRKRMGKKRALPQMALVTLDARNGAIKALVGGRNYQESQLNRVFAKRPPGSTFKPFVYAAALNKQGANITAGSRFIDEPTTFMFNNQPYQPANFDDRYMGSVTVRKAVMHSLNIPTIKVAEKIGFTPVVELAKAAGITTPLQPTPSLALGSYEVPPIELAEAYTIFSNKGLHVKRHWVTAIRDQANKVVYNQKPETNRVLDERVAYIMTNIMEDVVRAGTAGSVRSRGFTAPAAGKTGTARDGWFAGFTSELLTVVWVGYDDYSDLDMEGSKSALPVWTEFMKKAHSHRMYRDPKPFKQPEGIVKASIDGDTGLLAGEMCRNVRTELFLTGTQPKQRCEGHYEDYGYPAETVSMDMPRKSVLGRVLDVFR
jgi:penicillin-binding protein 1B